MSLTQTNEPGRCAVLLPVLAALPQPLALIEVGASAGLCLYPDRYRYRYDDGPLIGPAEGQVVLECRTSGPVPLPEEVPAVAWRADVDLNPLDVHDDDDVRSWSGAGGRGGLRPCAGWAAAGLHRPSRSIVDLDRLTVVPAGGTFRRPMAGGPSRPARRWIYPDTPAGRGQGDQSALSVAD